MPIRCFLRLKGIDDFEKRKTVKVSILSADLPDSVLAHEDALYARRAAGCPQGEEFLRKPAPRLPDVVVSVPECRGLARQAAPVRSSKPPSHSTVVASLVGGSSRAEIHARSTRLSTRHPRVLASVPTSHGSRHETVNRRRRHTPRRWYRQSALSPFHGLVQSIPIRDVDQCASAVERGQGRDVKSFPLGPEQPA